MSAPPSPPPPGPAARTSTRRGPARWILAGAGLICLALAILGAVLPGLPTTIFLLAATWCFARSYPSWSRRVLAMPLFRPVRGWVEPGGRVSRRAKGTALLAMWAAIVLTVHLLLGAEGKRWSAAAAVIALGGIGSWFIVRHGRRAREGLQPVEVAGDDGETEGHVR